MSNVYDHETEESRRVELDAPGKPEVWSDPDALAPVLLSYHRTERTTDSFKRTYARLFERYCELTGETFEEVGRQLVELDSKLSEVERTVFGVR